MKLIRLLLTFLLTTVALFCLSQAVIVQSVIKLPTDTAIKNELIWSLNGFLKQQDRLNKNNEFVLKENLLAMSDLLDEISGMAQG